MDPKALADLLAKYPRIAIAGGPRTGKTMLAGRVTDRPVLLAKDFELFGIEAAPVAMIAATSSRERFVIEGVWVARALRKGMAVDAVIYLHRPRVKRIPGQIRMAKGVHTVFKQWRETDKETSVYVVG